MKLTTMTQVTVEGVMQGNGGASDEDRRNGFERGGWAMGAGDDETMALINETYQRADAFLFGGGRTSSSPTLGRGGASPRRGGGPDNNPIAAALNTKPKYLARPRSPTALGEHDRPLRRPRGCHRRAEGQRAGELQVHGSGTLIRWLLEHDLVDEMTCSVVPVVLGQGARLFPRPARTSRWTSSTREPTRRA